MITDKFELKSSWYLTIIFLFIHLGAIVVVVILPLSLWVKGLLLTLCFSSLVFNLRHQALRLNSKSIVKFWQETAGTWSLEDCKGNLVTANLQGDSICTLYFVLLNFRFQSRWRRCSIVILPDAMQKDDLRRLRVLLRMRIKN